MKPQKVKKPASLASFLFLGFCALAGLTQPAWCQWVDLAKNRPLFVFSSDEVDYKLNHLKLSNEEITQEMDAIALNYCLQAGFEGLTPGTTHFNYSLDTINHEKIVNSLQGPVHLKALPDHTISHVLFSRLLCSKGTSLVFTDDAVDISIPPTSREIRRHQASQEVTLGDLHGNALKLLHFLVREGVIRISPKDYEEFFQLYDNESFSITSSLDPDTIGRFRAILDRIQIEPVFPMIRLIGDILCDRGANDFFTLKILEKLRLSQVPLEIVLSNHDLEFLRFFFLLPLPPHLLPAGKLPVHFRQLKPSVSPRTSLERLINTSLAQPEIWKETGDIFAKHYLPALRVISVSENLDHHELAFFSHAWVGIDAVATLAHTYGIPNCGISQIQVNREQLKSCVRLINQTFFNELVTPPFPSTGIRRIEHQIKSAHNFINAVGDHHFLADFSIHYTIWNRGSTWNRKDSHLGNPSLPKKIEDFSIHYLFGHVGEDAGLGHGNLDTHLGKAPALYEGSYKIHRF